MQRTLIIIGAVLLVLGLLWPWLGKLLLGKLPGDIIVERENFRFYFPITTMVVVSILITLVLWLLRK